MDNTLTIPREIGEYLFPELKESEDEKIRKAIHIYLDWLDGRKDYAPRGEYTIRDMIAWLEKQGESTDINPSEFDLRLNKLLKQFETLSKEELASSLSFYLNVVQNDGTYKAEEKQGEQKPAKNIVEIWKDMRLEVYQQASGNRHEPNYSDDTTKMFSLNDIDEIIEKMSEQKPADWSEEDERIFGSFLHKLEVCDLLSNKEIRWAKRRLKSLRPQNHWKPTEAQLASLTIACDRNDRIGFDLTELLKELKNL